MSTMWITGGEIKGRGQGWLLWRENIDSNAKNLEDVYKENRKTGRLLSADEAWIKVLIQVVSPGIGPQDRFAMYLLSKT